MTVYRYPHNAMYCYYHYGPTFGGGHDLRIVDNCDKNTNSYSNLGSTYKLPAGYTYGTTQATTLLAGSYKFKVDEYEVFFQPGKFTRNDRKINTYILSFSVSWFLYFGRMFFYPYVILDFDKVTLQGPFPFV